MMKANLLKAWFWAILLAGTFTACGNQKDLEVSGNRLDGAQSAIDQELLSLCLPDGSYTALPSEAQWLALQADWCGTNKDRPVLPVHNKTAAMTELCRLAAQGNDL